MDSVDDRIAAAPLPTARTLRMRTSLPIQVWRFVLINDSTVSRSVGVKLLRAPSGRSYGRPAAYTTSATSNLAPAAAPVLDASTRTVTTTLPGRSVTTMVVPW